MQLLLLEGMRVNQRRSMSLDILDFDWGLSSGQLAIFNMISKLIYSRNSQFVKGHSDEISSHIMFKENFNSDDAFFAVIKLLGIIGREINKLKQTSQKVPENILTFRADSL